MADRYEILDKIGTGGMSDVYKAMDHLLGRNVAVKVLKSEYSEDVNFLSKFRTEAQAAAGLEHPNIVNIYDVGSENKMHYIVMEYVEGITLKTYIEKKEKLSYKEAISIAIQTANGIRVAHSKQIVHRDIKPQNIMISTEGKVKVTDFGIARAASSNTINSEAMGSVHYASPEQARNGFIDTKSDIYSLGIVMYEMVTGRVPFHGDTVVSVALQHLQEEIVLPSVFTPDIPISFEKIILKCVQKSPDRRYATIDDLIVDLKKALINPDEDFVVMDFISAQSEVNDFENEEVATRETGEVSEETAGEDDLLNEEDDEAYISPKVERVITIFAVVFLVIVAVLIFLIIGNVAKWWDLSGKKPNDPQQQQQQQQQEEENKVEVIDVRGMTFEEAKTALNKIGLGIVIEEAMTSETVEAGLIISQDVQEGVKVAPNTTIKVIVSLGKEVAENVIPDIIGFDADKAADLLQNSPYSLVVTLKYEYSDEIPMGEVMDISPKVGTSVKAGSKVTIVVSRGEEEIALPEVVGMSETQALAKLEELKFTNVKVEYETSDTVEEGYVISQTPEKGKKAKKGDEIVIVVSKGKATKYYNFSYEVTIPEDLQAKLDDGTYTRFLEMEIRLILDGSTKNFMTWNTESTTKEISVENIENVSKGQLVVLYVFEVAVIDEETGEPVLDEEGNPTYEEKSEEVRINVTFVEAGTENGGSESGNEGNTGEGDEGNTGDSNEGNTGDGNEGNTEDGDGADNGSETGNDDGADEGSQEGGETGSEG